MDSKQHTFSRALVIGLCLLICGGLWLTYAQEGTSETNDDFIVFGIKGQGGLGIPLGTRTEVFGLGGGGFFSGSYSFPFYPPLSVNVGAGYHLASIKAEDSVSFMYGGGGLTLQYRLPSIFGVGGWVNGGYGYGLLNSEATIGGGAPYVQGGLFVSFFLSPQFSLGVEGTYRHFFNLYHDVQVAASASYYFNAKRIKAIEFFEPEFRPVFPLLQHWYGENAVGTMMISNIEDKPIEEVRVTLFLPGIMEEPRECRVTSEIGSGRTVEVKLFADMSGLELTYDRSKTNRAEIEVSYKYGLFGREQRYGSSLGIMPNYSIRWDDFTKAALFVTEGDPAVTGAAGSVEEALAPLYCRKLDGLLVDAMGLWELFGENGFVFNVLPEDPAEGEAPSWAEETDENLTPFRDYLLAPEEMDTVGIPSKTMDIRAGDSAELTALFMSAAAAAGMEPAFLIVPGTGMLPAFKAAPSGEEGFTLLKEKYFRPEELFIEEGGFYWLPLDIRDYSVDFLKAVTSAKAVWEAAAGSEAEAGAGGRSKLITLAEARRSYTPREYPAITKGFDVPETMGDIYKTAEAEQIAWMLEAEIVRREGEIASSGGDVQSINSLGVLHAHYEQFNKAVTQFQKVLLRSEYMPALVNMGNIYYMRDEMKMALPFYDRAYAVGSFDPRVILAVAKANHKLENYGSAKEAYEKLTSLDPALAEKFRYLSLSGEEAVEAARQIKDRDVVEWIEE